ncbi:MAG: hypothetical protein K2G38_01245 [Clostridia bacterium]|nr:hypothetical protein [Clostridia bacterium]
MEITEKEEYAKLLAKRAEWGLKAVKIAFIAIVAVAAAFALFAIISSSLKLDHKARLIVYIVFAVIIVLLLCAVVGAFVYTKLNLEKLKKLN